MAIGVNPVHHFTVVRFGKDTQIPQGSLDAISASGNSYFKAGDFTAGINNIIRASTEARSTIKTAVLIPSDEVASADSSAAYWALGIFGSVIVVVTAIVCYNMWRTKKKREEDLEYRTKLQELDNVIAEKKLNLEQEAAKNQRVKYSPAVEKLSTETRQPSQPSQPSQPTTVVV